MAILELANGKRYKVKNSVELIGGRCFLDGDDVDTLEPLEVCKCRLKIKKSEN